MASLVLLSGGMDSVIAFYDTLRTARVDERYAPVHAITFDYGQTHRAEVQRAAKVIIDAKMSDRYRDMIGEHNVADLGMSRAIPRTGSLLGQVPIARYDRRPTQDQADHDPAFIPYRNLLFFASAAMWAHYWKAMVMVTGLRGGFPDCTAQFDKQMQCLLEIAAPAHNLRINGPLHGLSRATSITLATRLPGCMDAIAWTITCFAGQDTPCQHCLPCLARAEGFAEAGVPDPLLSRLKIT